MAENTDVIKCRFKPKGVKMSKEGTHLSELKGSKFKDSLTSLNPIRNRHQTGRASFQSGLKLPPIDKEKDFLTTFTDISQIPSPSKKGKGEHLFPASDYKILSDTKQFSSAKCQGLGMSKKDKQSSLERELEMVTRKLKDANLPEAALKKEEVVKKVPAFDLYYKTSLPPIGDNTPGVFEHNTTVTTSRLMNDLADKYTLNKKETDIVPNWKALSANCSPLKDKDLWFPGNSYDYYLIAQHSPCEYNTYQVDESLSFSRDTDIDTSWHRRIIRLEEYCKPSDLDFRPYEVKKKKLADPVLEDFRKTHFSRRGAICLELEKSSDSGLLQFCESIAIYKTMFQSL